jgi:hypothetical protein
VWLYNSAGLEYDAAGDHPRALRWLTSGLQLALDTGDPERLVGQLTQLRRQQLDALGYGRDELDTRAETFLAQPRPRPPGWSPTQLPAVLNTLDTAPGSPLAPTALVPPDSATSATTAHPRVALAVSWFPAEEFLKALQQWPELAQDWDTTDYRDYTHRLERHLHNLTAANPARLWIAPSTSTRFSAGATPPAVTRPPAPPAPDTPPTVPAPRRLISSPGHQHATRLLVRHRPQIQKMLWAPQPRTSHPQLTKRHSRKARQSPKVAVPRCPLGVVCARHVLVSGSRTDVGSGCRISIGGLSSWRSDRAGADPMRHALRGQRGNFALPVRVGSP